MKVVASYFKMKPTRLLVIRWLAYRWFFIEWECFRPSLYVCTYNWKNTFAFAVSGHDSSLIPLQFFLSFRPLEDKRSSGEQMSKRLENFDRDIRTLQLLHSKLTPLQYPPDCKSFTQIKFTLCGWTEKWSQYHFIIYYDFNYLCDHNAN